MASGRAAIILAAGASQRMGTPKALLAWGNSTLLEYAVEQVRNADASEVVVVLGPATREVRVEATTVFNPDPQTGRSASIRLAASVLPDTVHAVVVQSVDQPVTSDILELLYRGLAEASDVVIPTYRGRRGHPVCVSGRLLPELQVVTEEEQGLRAVVRRHADHLVEVAVDTESVVRNLNDPAAYAAARAEQ
ncbi:MAG TPA: nucleotidyltransferase family protein [Chloroflexota bacterium]